VKKRSEDECRSNNSLRFSYQFHRKKLESRRLDFDCKKRRRPTSQAEQDDLNLAQFKFEQSLNLAAAGMHGLLQNQTEHINQLCTLAQALQEYHAQCAVILEGLTSRLGEQYEMTLTFRSHFFISLTALPTSSDNQQQKRSCSNAGRNLHTKESGRFESHCAGRAVATGIERGRTSKRKWFVANFQ
jgi:hypothetical protein